MQLIHDCDVNGDGKIDFEEFERCMTVLMNENLRRNTAGRISNV